MSKLALHPSLFAQNLLLQTLLIRIFRLGPRYSILKGCYVRLKETLNIKISHFSPGVPRAADHKCCGGQPAHQHPELVQERPQTVPHSHTHCGAIPMPGYPVLMI